MLFTHTYLVLFLILLYNYIISPLSNFLHSPLLPQIFPFTTLPCSLSNSGSFHINYYYTWIYKYTHTYTNLNTVISTTDLFGLYNCFYVFRDDLLIFDSYLLCPSLQDCFYSFQHLLVACRFCVVLRLPEISSLECYCSSSLPT